MKKSHVLEIFGLGLGNPCHIATKSPFRMVVVLVWKSWDWQTPPSVGTKSQKIPKIRFEGSPNQQVQVRLSSTWKSPLPSAVENSTFQLWPAWRWFKYCYKKLPLLTIYINIFLQINDSSKIKWYEINNFFCILSSPKCLFWRWGSKMVGKRNRLCWIRGRHRYSTGFPRRICHGGRYWRCLQHACKFFGIHKKKNKIK